MIAAVGDTAYNVVQLVHILTVIIGTGLVLVAPIMVVRQRRANGAADDEIVDDVAAMLVFPMLLVAGIAGGALVGLSDDFWDFGQTWLAMGGAVWIAVLGLVLAVYPPDYLRLVDLSPERRGMATGVLHLAIAVMLVLMVWKFGAP